MIKIQHLVLAEIPHALTLAQYLISLVNLGEGSVLMLQDEVALVKPHVICSLQCRRLPHGLKSLYRTKSFSHCQGKNKESDIVRVDNNSQAFNYP